MVGQAGSGRLDAALEAMPVAVVHLVEDSVVAANAPARNLFDATTDRLLDDLLPEDRAALLDAARRVAAGEEGGVVEVEVRRATPPPRTSFAFELGPHPDGGAIAVARPTTELRRLDAAVTELATGVYTTDSHLRGQWMPARLARGIGIDPELFVGIDVYALLHPDDHDRARALVAVAIANPGVHYTLSARILHPSQLDTYHSARIRATWLPDDDALGGLLVMFDTGIVDHRLASDGSGLDAMSLQDSTPLGFLNLTLTGEVLLRSSRAREILRPVSDVDDASDWVDLVRPDDRAVVDQLLATVRAGEFCEPVEIGLQGKGATVWVRLEAQPYSNQAGEVTGTFVNLLDVTAKHEAKAALADARERLWHQARHDALTGLFNRAPFVDRLSEVLTTGTDDAGNDRRADDARRPAVIVCDLDGFKAVNDTYGHRTGDDVLIEVARRLQLAVRDSDTLCRYGGDEFLVLCEDVHPAELTLLADRIVEAITGTIIINGVQHAVGISVGIALARPGDETDPDELVRRADHAMYDAKTAGGRRAVLA